MRFLDLELEDRYGATTIWLFREALMEAGLIDRQFERFGQQLEAKGYIARAARSLTPRFKAGETPEGREQQPAKDAQTDKDARWTKKNDAGSQKLDDVLDLSNTGKGSGRLPLGADRRGPDGEGRAEPYPPAQ